jgi:N-acetylglutamate synthase-like GNAT family acetyltransferase
MSLPNYHIRRATVDDKPALLALWASMHIPTSDLERRLTEFQVIESGNNQLLGALGMEVIERQGRLHSEAFSDFGLSGELRELLWARMQSVATNYGLARLWTTETAPFWKQTGFRPADDAALKRLPAGWAELASVECFTMLLRDEDVLHTALNRDFDALKLEASQKTEKALRVARFWNYFATGLAIVVAIAVIIFCVSLLKNNSHLAPH